MLIFSALDFARTTSGVSTILVYLSFTTGVRQTLSRKICWAFLTLSTSGDPSGIQPMPRSHSKSALQMAWERKQSQERQVFFCVFFLICGKVRKQLFMLHFSSRNKNQADHGPNREFLICTAVFCPALSSLVCVCVCVCSCAYTNSRKQNDAEGMPCLGDVWEIFEYLEYF